MTEQEVIAKLNELTETYGGGHKVPGAKTVYLQSPWWKNKQQKHLISSYEALLKNPTVAYVYAPILNQFEGNVYSENGDFEPDYMWAKQVYLADVTAMNGSEIGVLLETPSEPDAGSEYEAGYMTAQGKPVIAHYYNGEINDKENPVNLMISFGVASYVTSPEELQKFNFLQIKTKVFEGKII